MNTSGTPVGIWSTVSDCSGRTVVPGARAGGGLLVLAHVDEGGAGRDERRHLGHGDLGDGSVRHARRPSLVGVVGVGSVVPDIERVSAGTGRPVGLDGEPVAAHVRLAPLDGLPGGGGAPLDEQRGGAGAEVEERGDAVVGDHRRHPLAAGVDVHAEAAELVVQRRAPEVRIEQRDARGPAGSQDTSCASGSPSARRIRSRTTSGASSGRPSSRAAGECTVVSRRRTSLACTAPWSSTERNRE